MTEGGRAFNEVNLMIDARRVAEKAKTCRLKSLTLLLKTTSKNTTQIHTRFLTGRGGFNVITRQSAGTFAACVAGAKENTHTQDSENGIARNLSQTIAQNPYLTFVVPFVRTPTNLLTLELDAPFGVISQVFKKTSKKHREAYRQATPQERAEINGRLATSVATTAGLFVVVPKRRCKKTLLLDTDHAKKLKEKRGK